jgi:hypothetical protein
MVGLEMPFDNILSSINFRDSVLHTSSGDW